MLVVVAVAIGWPRRRAEKRGLGLGWGRRPPASAHGSCAGGGAGVEWWCLPAVERGLRDIIAADRRFDPQAFVDGARAAYRMILEAFWRGDAEELRHLCDADVAQSFIAAIEARKAAGETVDNRLVRIEEVSIADAAFKAPLARISLRFVADIAAVTRDAEGNVIAGSLDDAVVVRDVWTFVRDVTSTDPDWLLDETDEG